MNLPQNVDIERAKSTIANQYGVTDFENIDRGEVSSRSNGDITRTLVEMAEKQMTSKNTS